MHLNKRTARERDQYSITTKIKGGEEDAKDGDEEISRSLPSLRQVLAAFIKEEDPPLQSWQMVAAVGTRHSWHWGQRRERTGKLVSYLKLHRHRLVNT